jgi:selenide,water dikinase
MARLNLTGAKLMHKYKARAATDVTGFGILGHAKNLAENQIKPVDFTLHTLPIISNMLKIAKGVGNMFQLMQGYSAETSGGLLMAISKEGAEGFTKELEDCDAWIIGSVEEGTRTSKIVDTPTIIEV